MPARRLAIVYNPAAGRRSEVRLRAVLDALAARGVRADLLATAATGDATRLARAAALNGADAVVAAGGDGTINEVANGLAGTSVALGIVPLGTINLVARELGLVRSPADVAAVLAEGMAKLVRPGLVNGRLFLAVAGVGFDADAVAGVDVRLKARIGRAAYAVAGARRLMVGGKDSLEVIVDGRHHAAASVIIAKGRFYAGPFVPAPDAALDRPALQVCLLRGGGRVDLLRYAAALARGALHRLADVTVVTGTTVRLDGPPGAPVQADGDIVATLPVEIRIAPAPLGVLAPAV